MIVNIICIWKCFIEKKFYLVINVMNFSVLEIMYKDRNFVC